MKKLITLLAIVLTVQCTGQMASFESLEDRPKQEIYYKIYVKKKIKKFLGERTEGVKLCI